MRLKDENRAVFDGLIDIITDGYNHYLSAQIEAGAEVVKLFDSWAGSLQGRRLHEIFNRTPCAVSRPH